MQAPSRRFCGWAEQDQRLLVPHAQRRLLHLPEYHRDRMAVEETGGCDPAGSRGGVPLGHSLWRLRRGLSALQRSEFAGESEQGAGSDSAVDGKESMKQLLAVSLNPWTPKLHS